MAKRTLLAAILVSFPLLSAKAWYPYPETYNRWQKSRPFLLSALHNSVPTDRLAERMERFKAAGLNTFCWSKPWNAMHMYRAAHAAGLEWACWLPARPPSGVKEFMSIPGNSFIQVGDEPNTEEDLDRIAEVTKWVREHYPDRPVFGNLSIADVDHDTYVEKVKPDVFSFDHYPLQRNGETHTHYLYNLNWGRRTAIKHGLPYWMYLQTFGRTAERASYAYRVPDEADLRFLVYTFLAHGGAGISFFHYYGHPESMIIDTGVKNPARTEQPHIYENTIMTRAWYALRDVAPEVQNLAPAILDLRPKGEVIYAGNPLLWGRDAPGYSQHNPDPPLRNHPFAPHGALKSVRVADDDEMGVLVSFFDDAAGQEYFMVVNLQHGLNMSKLDGMRTVRLHFDPQVAQVERLNRLSGKVEKLRTFPGEGGAATLTLRLEGGTGDLLKWANGTPWSLR